MKKIILKNRQKIYFKKTHKKAKLSNSFYSFRKIVIILFLILVDILISKKKHFPNTLHILQKEEPKDIKNIYNTSLNITEQLIKLKSEEKDEKYFACIVTTGKRENLYAKQFIDYYISIGFDKFILGDNNSPNTEKLSDVLQEYIKNKKVDIIDIIGISMGPAEFFYHIYNSYKDRCEWFGFFDFDEYLEMHNEPGKNIDLKKYLSNPSFDKCESIGFNWLMCPDNNLLHYDERPLLERFPFPNYNDNANGYVKSMIRGKLDRIPFFPLKSSHRPEKNIKECDANGNLITNYNPYGMNPNFEHAYLKHFNTKTAEEYVNKIKRGDLMNRDYDPMERIKCFFSHNKFTDEKLKIFEKAFNLILNRNDYKNLYNGN